MIELMCGNNWDLKLLEGYIELNKKYQNSSKVRISEIYGSLLDNPIGTARPDYRVQDKSQKYFEDFIQAAGKEGIHINYTLNIPCFGSLEDLSKKEKAVIDFLKYLQDVGVYRVTIAHPLLIEFVKTYTNLKVELSTIYEIESVSQLKEFADMGVDKICMKVSKNRHFLFLAHFMKAAIHTYGIEVELIANEFCYLFCRDRKQCYNLHGHTKEKNRLYNFYPMGHCINKRFVEPVEWIKAPFILPQWMGWYERQYGINHFKITGRTHPTDYILKVVEWYMSRRFDGNLLDLWAHLENIGKDKTDLWSVPSYDIRIDADSRIMQAENFLGTISGNNIDCSLHCDGYCDLCYRVLKELIVVKARKVK